MRIPLRVISSTLLFAAFSIAQTATTTLPPAKPSARSATGSSEPQGVAGDCPGGFNCNGERKAAAVTVSAPSAAKSTWQAIHNSALVVDTHADTPGRFVDENFDLSQDAGKGYMDFNKIKAGNLGAEFWSIWVDPKALQGPGNQARARHDRLGVRAGAPPSRQDDDGLQHPGHLRRASPAQAGRADGRRGRTRHPGRHSRSARLLPSRRALHDADLVEHQRAWRLQRRPRQQRHRAPQRHHRFRTPGGPRDEPHGHDGRYLARRRPHDVPGAGHQPRTGDRLALFVAGADQCSRAT